MVGSRGPYMARREHILLRCVHIHLANTSCPIRMNQILKTIEKNEAAVDKRFPTLASKYPITRRGFIELLRTSQKELLETVFGLIDGYPVTQGVSQSSSYDIGKNHGRQEMRRDLLSGIEAALAALESNKECCDKCSPRTYVSQSTEMIEQASCNGDCPCHTPLQDSIKCRYRIGQICRGWKWAGI